MTIDKNLIYNCILAVWVIGFIGGLLGFIPILPAFIMIAPAYFLMIYDRKWFNND